MPIHWITIYDMFKKYLEICKKFHKIILTIIGLSTLSIVNTFKGYILSHCGYNYEFWITELISLLISISLLFFLWNIIHEGTCITIKKNK
jgi:hypothetical protein